MADKVLQPLQDRIKIVNDDGTPTQYFIRWAQIRQEDIQNTVTPAQVEQAIADWALARDIIAGVGLNGGGNLSADITLDADIQELLNLISTTRGSVLYRGNSAWAALAPGTAGQVLSTNGAGADPSWIAAGSGGGTPWWLQPPTAASFAVQSGDANLPSLSDDTDEGMLFNAGTPVNTDVQRFAYRTLTDKTKDWSMVTKVVFDLTTSFMAVGLMMRDTVGGKNTTIQWSADGAGRVDKGYASGMTAFTARSQLSGTNHGTLQWLRVDRVGANFVAYISGNGKQWRQILSESVTANLANAPDRVGFFARTGSTNLYFSVPYFKLTGPAV